MVGMADIRKYLAEMFGTFLLVFLAVGTAVFLGVRSIAGGLAMIPGGDGLTTAAFVVTVALAFGLALMMIVYVIGPISGAHVNPAVSLAMAINKKLSWKDFLFYVIAQLVGAIVAALLIWGIIRSMGYSWSEIGINGSNNYESLNADSRGLAILAGLLIETVLTFIFIFTILAVTRNSKNKKTVGFIIGLTLALVHLVAIPLTGTSVNPARSFGPAIFGGTEALRQVWLFIVAPLAGAALAAIAARCMFKADKAEDEANEVEEAKA